MNAKFVEACEAAGLYPRAANPRAGRPNKFAFFTSPENTFYGPDVAVFVADTMDAMKAYAESKGAKFDIEKPKKKPNADEP